MKEITQNYDNLFTKGARIDFQVFPQLEISDENLELLHLSSSTVLSGKLKNICFFNASFFSTKFSDVTFAQCNLKSIDMCSVWASGCQFLDCDFSDATISDSTFINCCFDNSILESISLTRCQFIHCSLKDISTDDSTIFLNTFTHCHIEGAGFKESFHYQTFENCTFSGVCIAPELLGYNFGFSPELFDTLSQEIDLDELEASFTGSGLYVNAAILHMNRFQDRYDAAMIACVVALGKMIQNDILIKADEIEFLKNLTVYFQTNHQIAPISVLQIWQLLNNYFMDKSSNTAASKAMPHIHGFANTLYFSYMEFQKELQDQLMQLPQTNNITDKAELEIVYVEKPSLPLLDYLLQFSALAGPSCPEPQLLRTERGSFHEFHEIALIIMPYLQTFFSLLGVIKPIGQKSTQTVVKQSQEEEATKNFATTESNRIEIALSISEANQPLILLPNMETIRPETSKIVLDVMKISSTKTLISSVDFGGYNGKNVESITIHLH